MNIEGEHIFAASQEIVWDMLKDPAVLVNVLPGCEKLILIGENEYEGVLHVHVGAVQGKMNGTIKLEKMQPPHSHQMHVNGRGAIGYIHGSGDLNLHTITKNTTSMTYSGSVEIGGKIASGGQRLLETSARSVLRQCLEGFDAFVVARTQIHTTNVFDQRQDTAVSPSLLSQLPLANHKGLLVTMALAFSGALLAIKWLYDWWAQHLAHKIARILREEAAP